MQPSCASNIKGLSKCSGWRLTKIQNELTSKDLNLVVDPQSHLGSRHDRGYSFCRRDLDTRQRRSGRALCGRAGHAAATGAAVLSSARPKLQIKKLAAIRRPLRLPLPAPAAS